MAISDVQMRDVGSTRAALGEALADTDAIKLISLDTDDGELYEATDAATRRVVGVNDSCERDHDEGDYIVVHRRSCLLKNSTSSPVLITHVGNVCYVEDSETVAASSTHSCVAGVVEEVVTAGVWVAVGVNTVVSAGS